MANLPMPRLQHPGKKVAIPMKLSNPPHTVPLHRQDFFSILWRWSAVTGVAFLVFNLTSGIKVAGLYESLIFAALIGLVNAFMVYILTMSTFSISVISVGIGALVLNFFIIEMFSYFPQFAARSLTDIFLAAIFISLSAWFATVGLGDSKIQV